VSSRVLAEILSGLEEGERVVTGQRQGSGAGAAGASAAGSGQRSGASGGMPPGGMPPR
jgi:macrolide-specific efflux system membrane fusion protein